MAGIGDALIATPFIHELSRQFPEEQIDALVLWRGSRDLLEGNSHLNSIHQKNFLESTRAESLKFLLQLRREHYDISFNTHPQSRVQYRIIARIINAKTRLSHLYDCSSWIDRCLINKSIPQDYSLHSVENNFNLLKLLNRQLISTDPKLEIFLSQSEHTAAESFIAEKGLPDKIRIGFHVGSGGTKNLALKRWPLENYRQFILKTLERRAEAVALLFGGPQEEHDHAWLTSQIQSDRVIVAPTPDLKHAAALIQRCHAFVSVDTALMHLAAAVKVPNQIVIEAPTLNKTNEPYRQNFTLVRNPMVDGRNLDYYRYDGRDIQGSDDHLKQCMASVTVDMVYQALEHSFHLTPPRK